MAYMLKETSRRGYGVQRYAIKVGKRARERSQVQLDYALDEALGEGAVGAKVLFLGGQSVFGLRVKGRVLNESVDEDPEVVLHLD